MQFFLADVCKSVWNVLNRSPYQNKKGLRFINFEQMTVILSYMPTIPVPLFTDTNINNGIVFWHVI